ncbi:MULTISPECIES: thiamine-binding protein [Allobacillus]|uniref:Thiamine-binding protein n=1 Tax=Allobacillus salarius TaxID=1955272 RepID=A0A556P6I6_9BACI|nr:thiamine-binding protein [Allobacillus salarius]TSJ60008.1 thiamine-binding protein [Allobacillus salarius]
MANALLSIQIIPKVDDQDLYSYVDEAIAVIEATNVKYSVHPLETTMEGELSELLQIVKKMNEKMSSLGAPSVISQVKIAYRPEGITMDELVEKYE